MGKNQYSKTYLIDKPPIKINRLAVALLEEIGLGSLDNLLKEDVDFKEKIKQTVKKKYNKDIDKLTDAEKLKFLYPEMRILLEKTLLKVNQIGKVTKELNSRYLDDITRALLSNGDIYVPLLYKLLTPFDEVKAFDLLGRVSSLETDLKSIKSRRKAAAAATS